MEARGELGRTIWTGAELAVGRALILLLASLGPGPLLAQTAEEPPASTFHGNVVVTANRVEEKFDEVAGNVTVFTRQDIKQSAAQTLDDFLRQVPGFSLFRRSSSIVAHPTTQGVSLRGISPSGVSRTLVLLDGVPVNDPLAAGSIGAGFLWKVSSRSRFSGAAVPMSGVIMRSAE